MDRIKFTINGETYTVGPEIEAELSINDYVRNHMNLRGTKYMCKEGGCGGCIVAVTAPDPNNAGHKRTFSVNSCLVLIASCDGWVITTIEHIGNRRKGYHPIQRTLAEYNGTQCGYCSTGWVMSMHSLLEANQYEVSEYEIENAFGSNVCRCTGYRPILEAFKSFAKDPKRKDIVDIEDLSICGGSEKGCNENPGCEKSEWCLLDRMDAVTNVKEIHFKDDRIWYRVLAVKDVFDVFEKEGVVDYRFIAGNTGKGVVPIITYPRVLIDVSAIDELKTHYLDQNLVIGTGTTISELMTIFRSISADRSEFRYLQKLNEHLEMVAHIPVRNIGTIAGNLMTKHKLPSFSSDIFLLFECIGATVTIVDKHGDAEMTLEDFLKVDMAGKVMTVIKIPPFSTHYRFVSFKIMPRSQNARAQVNSAFLYKFDRRDNETVTKASIVYGGLSGKYSHARKTEEFLVNKRIFTDKVLQEVLKVLDSELIVEEIPGEHKPEYRKKCALGLFYKGLLSLIPENRLNPRYRSGASDFRKTRPISKSIQVHDTNPAIWPVTEPTPKAEALAQTSGEIFYVNDLPKQAQEVWCAFVTSNICKGEIESIDPSPALEIPGVITFISAKDIPGKNSFLSQKVPATFAPEEIFASSKISYHDQAIGAIVAETETIANRAAPLVRVKYKVDPRKPILTIKQAREAEPERVSLFLALPARDRGRNVQRVMRNTSDIFWQYAFTMETLSCVTRPNDDGLDVYTSAQWPDSIQNAVADCLNIPQNRINVIIPRCGGAYGSRISRINHPTVVSALVTHLTGRPSRFVMSLQANMRVIGKRLPCQAEFEVGVNDNGEIQYLEYHFYEDNGYVLSDPIIGLAVAALKSCYDNQRWQYKLFNVLTDTASNSYLRSPGSLEAIAMTEYIMEQISYELDIDQVRVRQSNLNPQYLDTAEVIRTVLEDSDYYKRREEIKEYNARNRWKKRGLSFVPMSWPVVLISDYQVLLTVFHGDGTIVIKHGGVELGQGINTRVLQVAAYTLNISVDKIKVKPTDVYSSPNALTTGGSRTTEAVLFGVIKCCQLLLDRLAPVRKLMNNPSWELLVQSAYNRGINLQTSYHANSNDQAVYRVSGAVVLEAEVDMLTGEHELLRVDLVEDVGTSINPQLDIGQIEGAFVMGLGYWTSEHFVYDKDTGELLTNSTFHYHVPLSRDIPIDFRVKLNRNSYNPLGTLGSREPATCLAISAGFAIRNAIVSSREETGYPRTKWFNVDGAYTLEANLLSADVRIDEFKFE